MARRKKSISDIGRQVANIQNRIADEYNGQGTSAFQRSAAVENIGRRYIQNIINKKGTDNTVTIAGRSFNSKEYDRQKKYGRSTYMSSSNG